MEIICGIYKITNTVTGDFYIGSSNDVKRRWAAHKWTSTWNEYPNYPLYKDMQKYGVGNFVFEILEEVEEEQLKETEQKFIERLNPTYNNRRADGWDIERKKETDKEYQKTDKYKEYKKQYNKEYYNQLCFYNGETLTLNALRTRLKKQGIDHPTLEAKKYLIQ